MEQTRSCTRPAPQHGGADCVGDKTRTVSCNNDACPPGESMIFSFVYQLYLINFQNLFSMGLISTWSHNILTASC